MMIGKPISSAAASASSILYAYIEKGRSIPILIIASLKAERSSPLLIASGFAPKNSIPSSIPFSCILIATLSAVCPPIVGRTASTFSSWMIRSIISSLIGSMYVLSANSGSVMMVAGFEFMSTTR